MTMAITFALVVVPVQVWLLWFCLSASLLSGRFLLAGWTCSAADTYPSATVLDLMDELKAKIIKEEQLDAYSTDTLQAQRVYLEKLHNTSGTVGEYMQKFGELVNASLDADGHGKHVFGKILMPLVMKGMSGLDKAGYADIAELLNDTMFEDGVSWVLRKSSGTVEKVKTVAGAETALLIKDVNTTLEATLSRFTSLSEAVSLSLDGLTGGISSMLLGRFPKECAHLITDPIKMVNNTKDNMIQSMDTFIDKMVGNVRDGMNTVVGVVGAAA